MNADRAERLAHEHVARGWWCPPEIVAELLGALAKARDKAARKDGGR